MAENEPKGAAAPAPAEAGQQQVALRLDERELHTAYANAFRTNATPEEMVVDFGFNSVSPAPQGQPGGQAQILFKLNNRVVLNYYTAKRLALSLGQVVRQYEETYGEIKLNAEERKKN